LLRKDFVPKEEAQTIKEKVIILEIFFFKKHLTNERVSITIKENDYTNCSFGFFNNVNVSTI